MLDWAANCLNQYTEFSHDADGNMTQCGDWAYIYDAANRLRTASSNGVLIVTNFYDAKSRRVKKVTTDATMTFFYDGWNLVEERISYTNGTTSTIRYYWGKDLSGTLQGAGGVGGLLYLTIDGVPYIPDYDNIGNITRYLDANGNVVAQYTYDAFGGTLSQSGSLASFFRHRFSTKYLDVETGLYYYGYRFYHPPNLRWLNRDPIEENGGVNIYGFCKNAPMMWSDDIGREPVSPFTFVGDPSVQNGHSGAYVGLWYPAAGIGSLYYDIDLTVKWGECDECCEKPGAAHYPFHKRISFWENEGSRFKDTAGNENVYINPVNTDPHGGNGFNGKLPTGMSAYRLLEDANLSLGAVCTWGSISIKINWYALTEKGPSHKIPSSTGGSVLWHEFLEKESFSSRTPPSGYTIIKSGTQQLDVQWSCKDNKSTVSSSPKIKNGLQRERRK